MRELEHCPSCGSGDVGGGSGIVHCYVCKDEVRDTTTPLAAEKWNIRAILMRHGFTIKPGETDLKPYVYAAARALLERERATNGNAGERAMQAACGELPEGYNLEVGLELGSGWVEVIDPEGNKLDFEPDPDGGSMTAHILAATQCAIEHANR